MANIDAPFGFRLIGRLGQGPMSGGLTQRKIKDDDSTNIFFGDPVRTLATGYINRGAAGVTSGVTVGIFVGCKFFSTAFQTMRWSPFWPGSGNTGDVTAYIIDDPAATFEVQASGSSAIGFADIGQSVDFALGTGNTKSGLSGASADQGTLGVEATKPFRVLGLVEGVGNGTDHSSQFNRIVVGWNDQFLRQFDGI